MKFEHVIFVRSQALTPAVPINQFVSAFDPDAFDGAGHVELTADLDRALRFPSGAAALGTWRLQSTVRPERRDGKPNRPMTAYTVEILATRPRTAS